MDRLSLRSDPRKSHTDPHDTKTGDDGTALDWYNSRCESPMHLEQLDRATTSSHIPLVHLGSKANASEETSPTSGRGNDQSSEPTETENGSGKVIRGFDAV